MTQQEYKSVALRPDTYYKVWIWADYRNCTLGEAVDYAFDNLGVPGEEDNGESTNHHDQESAPNI